MVVIMVLVLVLMPVTIVYIVGFVRRGNVSVLVDDMHMEGQPQVVCVGDGFVKTTKATSQHKPLTHTHAWPHAK